MKRADGTKLQPTTPAQLAFIRERWATMTSVEIGAALNMRPGTVKAIASKLRLYKHPAVISRARIAAVNSRKVHRGNFRRPTPFGTHRDLLLGLRVLELSGSSGRVHRCQDDEDLAA